MLFVSLFLTSLSVIISKSIMLLQMALHFFYGRVVFHVYHTFHILSSVDGHLGSFHVLALVSNAAIEHCSVHIF